MKKTMNAVINGISEKLEKFIDFVDEKFDLAGEMIKKIQNQIKVLNAKNQKRADAIKTLDDKIKELEQKANRTGQFHLDSINEKINKVEKKIEELEKYPLKAYNTISKKLDKKINDNKDNCVSNNDYKKLWEENTKDYNDLARKRLDDYTKGIKNSEKIEELEDSIKNTDIIFSDSVRKIFARMDNIEQNIPDIDQPTEQTDCLKDYCDRLESNYYKLRSELDAVYKVLEMDALDIQDLYNKLENHPKKNNINLSNKGGCDDE